MSQLQEYFEQDIWNPQYLFHGSPYSLTTIEPRQSYDAVNLENSDNAIFLTSSFLTATAYAFRNKLKEGNHKFYDFSINNNGNLPVMTFIVENVPNDLFGYVYVFRKTDDIVKDAHDQTTQYRCYSNLQPIDAVKVYYKDMAQYFNQIHILLESNRMYFVEMSKWYANDFIRIFSNPKTEKMIYGSNEHFSASQIAHYFQKILKENVSIFALLEQKSKKVIGFLSIPKVQNQIAEITIAIDEEEQGKGYGLEAIQTMLKYGYSKIGLNGFDLNVLKSNQKAINCYNHAGFTIDDMASSSDSYHMIHRK